MVDGFCAIIDDYTNNEFEPNDWTLYTCTEYIPEFSSIVFISTLIIATLAVIVVGKRKQKLT